MVAAVWETKEAPDIGGLSLQAHVPTPLKSSRIEGSAFA